MTDHTPAESATAPEVGAKTATLLGDNLKGFRGHAALFWLSEPLSGHDHVIVSSVNGPIATPSFRVFGEGESVHETYIFGADEFGKITDWAELPGSAKGTEDHARVLRNAGYEIQ